ncbi:MAG: hypothetical protein VYA30_09600 [Myxococcota bacterium]|nr:hypothetical protein [Myxococcota bacterium]
MALLYTDHPLNHCLGIDMILAAVHNQLGADWANAASFIDGGFGLSRFFNNRVGFTPNVLLYFGLRTNTWALVPGANLGIPLEGK